jgi:hypothetical protein
MKLKPCAPLMAIAALLPCCNLLSQTVWPQGYANVNGGAAAAPPFTISAGILPVRTRAVVAIAGSSLPFPATHVIHGIAFRRDAVYSTPYNGYNATVQVRLKSITNAAALTSAAHLVFSQSDEVFSGPVPVPGASSPGGGTAPFSLPIPFSTAWTYPGGDIAMEISVTGPAGSMWRCDAVRLPWNEGGISFGVGGGCPTSAGDIPPMIVRDLTEAHPGGTIEYVVDRLPTPPYGGMMAFLVGIQSPGYSPGPQFDPSCQVFLNPVAFAVSGQYGNRLANHARGGLMIAIPNAAAFAGLPLCLQGVYLDLGRTQGYPVGFTQAAFVEVGALPPPASSFIGQAQWIYGSLAPGSVQGLQMGPPNFVPVIEFQ